jgi:hypothetical protein
MWARYAVMLMEGHEASFTTKPNTSRRVTKERRNRLMLSCMRITWITTGIVAKPVHGLEEMRERRR